MAAAPAVTTRRPPEAPAFSEAGGREGRRDKRTPDCGRYAIVTLFMRSPSRRARALSRPSVTLPNTA